jgi:4,5-DOPA dioxygenase extradiol
LEPLPTTDAQPVKLASAASMDAPDMKAAPLLRAWLHRLRQHGAHLHVRHRWLGWADDGALRFATPDGEKIVAADATILALGGGSWAKLGSDGAWVPLRMMYPTADIPVIPLSIKPDAGAAYHYALGQALAPLAAEGFLIIGTGSMTHNLRDYMMCAQTNAPTPSYVRVFADWVETQLVNQDRQSLLDYRQTAPEATRAHPSEDHLMPFFVALGAAGTAAKAERFFAGIDDYVIAMDGYRFEQAVQ